MNLYAEIGSYLDNIIHKTLKKKSIVGTVVMVAKAGEIIYQRAAGFADREAQRPMQLNDPFLLSSLTKLFTAAATLRYVEQGSVALTDHVTRFLPDFTPKLDDGSAPAITIHQLLTHTAGLGYRFNEANAQGPYHQLAVSDGFDDIMISLTENLTRLVQAPLHYRPGEKWLYSLALDVLGGVLEAATKLSLPAIIDEIICAPLSLKQTGFIVKQRDVLVTHYHDAKPRPQPIGDVYSLRLPPEMDNAVLTYAPCRHTTPSAYPSGGAGMVGTAPEFMRFLLALTRGEIISADLVNALFKPHVSDAAQTMGPGWGFGYGGAVLCDPLVAVSPQSAGTLHWGGIYGHNWFYDPVKALAFVAFTNTGMAGLIGPFTPKLRDAIYARLSD